MAASSPESHRDLQRRHVGVQPEHRVGAEQRRLGHRRVRPGRVVAGVAVGHHDAEAVDAAAQADSTTRVLPPVVPAKVACIIASPNIWVTAMRAAGHQRALEQGASRGRDAGEVAAALQHLRSLARRWSGLGHRSSRGLRWSCGRGCRAGRSPAAGTASRPRLWSLSTIVDAVTTAHFSGPVTAGRRPSGAGRRRRLPEPGAAEVVDVVVEAGPRPRAATTAALRYVAPCRPPAAGVVRGACRRRRRPATPRTTSAPTIGGPSGRGQENSAVRRGPSWRRRRRTLLARRRLDVDVEDPGGGDHVGAPACAPCCPRTGQELRVRGQGAQHGRDVGAGVEVDLRRGVATSPSEGESETK